MQRHTLTPRPNWQARVTELGMDYHTIDGQIYWDESACFSLTTEEVERLEEATNTLEALCLEAVDTVIQRDWLERLFIPAQAHDLIKASWQNGERNIIGRFDLAFNGKDQPKMLEYNADTPTGLLEASVIQWQWLEDMSPTRDQFNSLHERLLEAWPLMGIDGLLHFSCVTDHPEDEGNTRYLQDTAHQAGLSTQFVPIHDIGSDGETFYDNLDQPIKTIFKLYPWEWLWQEDFAEDIVQAPTRWIEPPWKLILSNKAILPILWELFEGHELLLPAAFTPPPAGSTFVEKPVFSREGQGIIAHTPNGQVRGPAMTQDGIPTIYQQYTQLPDLGGGSIVFGSWTVASQSAGLGIREEKGPITTNLARFVPHYFE
jgi:glutathionylspermidine synthase